MNKNDVTHKYLSRRWYLTYDLDVIIIKNSGVTCIGRVVKCATRKSQKVPGAGTVTTCQSLHLTISEMEDEKQNHRKPITFALQRYKCTTSESLSTEYNRLIAVGGYDLPAKCTLNAEINDEEQELSSLKSESRELCWGGTSSESLSVIHAMLRACVECLS